MATFTAIAALSATRIRLDFSAPIDRSSALEDLENYSLEATVANTVVPRVLSVFVPSLDEILYVELRVPNMKNGGAYGVTVNPVGAASPITAEGIAVSSQFLAFTGIGVAPVILLVLADNKNQITVHFSAPILDFASTRDLGAWTLSGGLIVSQILDLESHPSLHSGALSESHTHIHLKTSDQTANTVYTLTFNGLIYDYYYNNIATPAVVSWLGWIEPTEEDPPFRLPSMYNFLFEGLRIEDEKGGELVRRYFEGFQTVWGAIVEFIYLLKLSKDPSKWSGQPLRYLANLIGWSEKLRTILDAIDDAKLRSLIALSPQFWKDRGSPDAEDGLIGLLTGVRRYQLDWFDLRTIIDEMEIGEEHEGTDPWMTSVPGDGSDAVDGYEYNLRIVDDGTLDRPLVRAAAKLSKPINERVLITYLLFLDQFEVAGDFTQFLVVSGANPTVSSGEIALTNGTQIVRANTEFATSWEDYIVSWRVRSTGDTSLPFRYKDDNNFYAVGCTPGVPGVGLLQLYRVVAGVFSAVLASFVTTPQLSLYPSVNHVIRVLVATVGANTHIEVFLDGNLAMTLDEATVIDRGSIGVMNAGSDAFVKEIEVLRLPVESDYIDINSEAV
jgi:hypothetical protein